MTATSLDRRSAVDVCMGVGGTAPSRLPGAALDAATADVREQRAATPADAGRCERRLGQSGCTLPADHRTGCVYVHASSAPDRKAG